MRATTGDYVHPGNGYRHGYRGLNIYTLVDSDKYKKQRNAR